MPPSSPRRIALIRSPCSRSRRTSRVPELVPIRYGRMLVSPFTFYRGAALIMASDLSTTPRSGLTAQICGDAHLSNFGVFGSPERSLVFDCNDFDETLPGPWEWDVKRLAASVVVSARELGFAKAVRTEAIVGLGRVYREAMREMAGMSNLEVWYSHVDIENVLRLLKAQAAATRLQGRDAHGRHRDQAGRQGPDQGHHEGARQADHGRRRRSAASSATRPSSSRSTSSSPTCKRKPSSSCSTSSCAATGPACRPTGGT